MQASHPQPTHPVSSQALHPPSSQPLHSPSSHPLVAQLPLSLAAAVQPWLRHPPPEHPSSQPCPKALPENRSVVARTRRVRHANVILLPIRFVELMDSVPSFTASSAESRHSDCLPWQPAIERRFLHRRKGALCRSYPMLANYGCRIKSVARLNICLAAARTS